MGKRFYRTLFELEVLSNEPVDGLPLEDLAYETDKGVCSGAFTVKEAEEVDAERMARLLEAQGSDPSFLGAEPIEVAVTVRRSTPDREGLLYDTVEAAGVTLADDYYSTEEGRDTDDVIFRVWNRGEADRLRQAALTLPFVTDVTVWEGEDEAG